MAIELAVAQDTGDTLTETCMRIYKEFTFEAAHRLTSCPPGHKCANLHGHSYRVRVYVDGPVGSDTGWIIDFSDIKTAFEPILEKLDHTYLNEVEGLKNTTCECLARWIWQRLKPNLSCLSKIDVHETQTTGCTYAGEDEADD